tara:strand:- start:153 stop:608 length:456 start_codon:yes stop_codon:yes gene_type:complete
MKAKLKQGKLETVAPFLGKVVRINGQYDKTKSPKWTRKRWLVTDVHLYGENLDQGNYTIWALTGGDRGCMATYAISEPDQIQLDENQTFEFEGSQANKRINRILQGSGTGQWCSDNNYRARCASEYAEKYFADSGFKVPRVPLNGFWEGGE